MKIFFAILLTILAFACKAQEPDVHCFSQEQMDSVKSSCIEGYSQEYIDSLNNKITQLESIVDLDKSLMITDTFRLTLMGLSDTTTTIINKTGENVSTSIKNGSKRITSSFSEGGRKVYLMNDTVHSADSTSSDTVGSFQLDENDRVYFYYDPQKALE